MNPNHTFEITKPKLLLAEGLDDKNFLDALVQFLKIDTIQITQYRGKNNLRSFLKTLMVTPGFDELESIGITRDADDSYTSALQSVNDAIQAQNFSIKISTFILPDRASPGMLEDLCIATLAIDELQCIDQYLECMQVYKGSLPRNLSKAKIYAWLATQSKPEIRLGEAALDRYFDFNHSAFSPLKAFILAL